MTGALPGGAWRALLPRALTLIDEIRVHGGIADPFWTLGGGTVLMFRHRHRLSKDIDIFVSDPQYLGFVTPRLNNVAADMTADYTEQPSAWVKLQFEEGEVDFAKKMFHRGDRVTARDLFDLALVVEREPAQLKVASPFLIRHRQAFLEQIRNPHPTLKTAFAAIATLDYTPDFDNCVASAGTFLEEL